ncbi:O-antigen ligase family protein [bacterium]|nr:O-antigen ligase family protein [bacterium]
MSSAKLVFVFISTVFFGIVPLFVRDRGKYFLFLVGFLYIFSSGWIFYHYTGLMLADLPVISLLLTGIVSKYKFKYSVMPVTLPLILFLIAGIVSSFFALQHGWVLAELSKYLRLYLVIIAVVNNVHSLKDFKIIVYAMIIGIIVESLIGIYQWRFGAIGIWYLGERSFARIKWRTMGTFFVTSFYANYLAMTLPVAFRLFLYYKPEKRKIYFIAGSAFILGTIAFFTTYGRAPWIAFSITLGLLFVISLFNKRFKSQIKWAFPVILIFFMAFTIRYGDKIISQFGAQRDASYEVRFPQFRIAGRIIKAHPVLGVGLGHYELVSWDYMTNTEKANDYAKVFAFMVHNSYLLIAAEMGLIGAILIIWYLISIFVVGIRILTRKLYSSFIINTVLGVLGGILAIIIVFTFSPDIHAYQILYQLGLSTGIILSAEKLQVRAEKRMKIEHLKKKKILNKQ